LETTVNVSFALVPSETYPRRQKQMKECVKAGYSKKQAEVWLNKLRFTDPELDWEIKQCEWCQEWHIVRTYPLGYVSEEAQKAIKLWKERTHGL
jgi:hypothetical protein